MKKKLFAVLSIVALGTGAFSLTSCGETSKTKIGIVMYGWSDIQGTTIQSYCDYLSKNLDVEFAYEQTYYQDDKQIECIENLISAGCDAVISGYDTSLVSAVDTCSNAGVYYAVALDHVTQDDFGTTQVSDYFLGGTTQFGGNLEAVGAEYAVACNNNGLSTIGGVSFPIWAFADGATLYNGFKAKMLELNPSATVEDCTFSSGFMQADIETATNTALQQNTSLDALFGLSSGIDYVYPVIKDKDIKLLSMGYDDSCEALFENGKLAACGTNNYIQSIASCVARILNAKDGKAYSDTKKGEIVNGVASYPVLGSTADIKDYKALVDKNNMNNCFVTVEELKNVILSYNENATLESLNKLTNRSIQETKASR